MKKISILLVIASLMVLVSCGNQGGKKASTKAISTEEAYAQADFKIKMDSLIHSLSMLQSVPLGKDIKDGKITLTAKEKKVKPNYLLPLSKAKDLVTTSQKWSGMAMYDIDLQVAKFYDMPTQDLEQLLAKLALDVNSPATTALFKDYDFKTYFDALYKEHMDNGTLDIYWTAVTAALVESLYITTNNVDKFMGAFTDESAAEISYRFILVRDAIQTVISFHPEMAELNKVMEPLYVINAVTVKDLRTQLIELKGSISVVRDYLLK